MAVGIKMRSGREKMTIKENLINKCISAKKAGKALAVSTGEKRNNALVSMAEALMEDEKLILEANSKDIERAKENGIKDAMVDRLMLNSVRLGAIADAMRKVALLPDPLGAGEVWTRPNGLMIKKVKVPLGNIAIIYESRPNVTADAVCLCIKSGNTVFLRGGKEAFFSNTAIISALRKGLEKAGFSGELIQTPDDTSRETATALMTLTGYVDLLIPRGGKSLIRSVVENATVPVIETGAGNCHVYVEKTADLDMAAKIVKNAKMQRPSVCNAAENLLVDREIAEKFLPIIKKTLEGTELRGCKDTRAIIDVNVATEEDFFTEYDDYIMSLKIVDGYEEAVEHINAHSTGHSEAIITTNTKAADYFTANIDSAAVYVNASTRFTDGEEFGFGAEIGISTQRLHARGPMGLSEMTTVKYIVTGDGQKRG